jgi:hypothetical protein
VILCWIGLFMCLDCVFCQQVCMGKISYVISTSDHADVYTNCILTGGSAKWARINTRWIIPLGSDLCIGLHAKISIVF